METFFQYFQSRTGYNEGEAKLVIRIISGHLAKNYPEEFLLLIQYFLTHTFNQKKPETNSQLEGLLKNQNI